MNTHPNTLLRITFLIVVLLAPAATAAAQSMALGLLVAAPGSIGLDVPLGERLTVRPAVSFRHQSMETDLGTNSSSTSSTSTIGSVTVPLFVTPSGTVRYYVAPEFSAQRSTFDVSRSDDLHSTLWSVGGVFGAQGGIGTRLAFFAEAGALWGWADLSGASGLPSTSHEVRTVALVGAVFKLR